MSYQSILLCYTILLQNLPYYVLQVLFLLVSIKIKKMTKLEVFFPSVTNRMTSTNFIVSVNSFFGCTSFFTAFVLKAPPSC